MGTDRTSRALAGRAISAASTGTRRRCRRRRASVLLVVGALALVAACSEEEADPNEPRDEAVRDIDARGAPVCLDVDDDLPPEVEKLPVVPCAVAHTHEIFATLVYDEGDVYPGAEALGSYAQVECLTPFEEFVGVSAFDSSLSYTWLVPSLNSWNDEKDREIWCTLADRDATPLTGSMAGSQR